MDKTTEKELLEKVFGLIDKGIALLIAALPILAQPHDSPSSVDVGILTAGLSKDRFKLEDLEAIGNNA